MERLKRLTAQLHKASQAGKASAAYSTFEQREPLTLGSGVGLGSTTMMGKMKKKMKVSVRSKQQSTCVQGREGILVIQKHS